MKARQHATCAGFIGYPKKKHKLKYTSHFYTPSRLLSSTDLIQPVLPAAWPARSGPLHPNCCWPCTVSRLAPRACRQRALRLGSGPCRALPCATPRGQALCRRELLGRSPTGCSSRASSRGRLCHTGLCHQGQNDHRHGIGYRGGAMMEAGGTHPIGVLASIWGRRQGRRRRALRRAWRALCAKSSCSRWGARA